MHLLVLHGLSTGQKDTRCTQPALAAVTASNIARALACDPLLAHRLHIFLMVLQHMHLCAQCTYTGFWVLQLATHLLLLLQLLNKQGVNVCAEAMHAC